MLEIYLSSVIIWMIILFCAAKLCGPAIKKNGWLEDVQGKGVHKIGYLFICSAVPFFRLLLLSGLVMMSGCTKEQYKNEHEDDE